MRHELSTLQILLLTLFAGCWLSTALGAQTNDDVNAGLQFNFSTPGARSLGMGGAFLALADDATAAYTNSGGLTNLTVGGSEISVEFRQWNFSNVFPDQGHIAGPPSGIGVDTVPGLQGGSGESRAAGFSFLSFGYVLPHGWTLAIYRQQLAKFEAQAKAQGFLVGAERGKLFRVFPTRSRLNLAVENYGLSAGYRLVQSDTFGVVSLGLGLSYYRSQISSRTERFFRGPEEGDTFGRRQPGGFFGVADYLGDNVNNVILQEGQDTDWGLNLGALWKIGPSEIWSLGAAYRRGPRLASNARFVYGPAAERADPRNRNGSVDPGVGGKALLHVPDVYGLGVAWSPAQGKARVTLDYDRVRYSQMIEGLTNVLLQSEGSFQRSDYRLSDVGEIHLGVEYVFLAIDPRAVCSVRFGAWRDPHHALEYIGANPVLRGRFRPGDDQNHLSAGLGLVVGENFQVDVAYDYSNLVRTFSLSLVKFF